MDSCSSYPQVVESYSPHHAVSSFPSDHGSLSIFRYRCTVLLTTLQAGDVEPAWAWVGGTWLVGLFLYFKDLIYLFMKDTQRQRHRQREKQALCREPDVGLNPRTPGSHFEPKADRRSTAEPPRCPAFLSFKFLFGVSLNTTIILKNIFNVNFQNL